MMFQLYFSDYLPTLYLKGLGLPPFTCNMKIKIRALLLFFSIFLASFHHLFLLCSLHQEADPVDCRADLPSRWFLSEFSQGGSSVGDQRVVGDFIFIFFPFLFQSGRHLLVEAKVPHDYSSFQAVLPTWHLVSLGSDGTSCSHCPSGLGVKQLHIISLTYVPQDALLAPLKCSHTFEKTIFLLNS